MLRHIGVFSLRCCSSNMIQVTPVSMTGVRCLQNLIRTRPTILTCRSSGVATPPPGRRRNIENFRITMSQEEKERKLKEIEKMRVEEAPKGLFAKFKYYFKRYWYIAVPVHLVCCSIWFAGIYVSVKSGVDVIALMQTFHLPERLIEKVRNVPESAGVLVISLLIYKVVMPLRYAMSLAGIQVAFWILRRMGRLKTIREVEYGVRSGYEKTIHRLNERRNRSAMISPNNATNITPASTLSRILSRRERLRQSAASQSPTQSASTNGGSRNTDGKNPSGNPKV